MGVTWGCCMGFPVTGLTGGRALLRRLIGKRQNAARRGGRIHMGGPVAVTGRAITSGIGPMGRDFEGVRNISMAGLTSTLSSRARCAHHGYR